MNSSSSVRIGSLPDANSGSGIDSMMPSSAAPTQMSAAVASLMPTPAPVPAPVAMPQEGAVENQEDVSPVGKTAKLSKHDHEYAARLLGDITIPIGDQKMLKSMCKLASEEGPYKGVNREALSNALALIKIKQYYQLSDLYTLIEILSKIIKETESIARNPETTNMDRVVIEKSLGLLMNANKSTITMFANIVAAHEDKKRAKVSEPVPVSEPEPVIAAAAAAAAAIPAQMATYWSKEGEGVRIPRELGEIFKKFSAKTPSSVAENVQSMFNGEIINKATYEFLMYELILRGCMWGKPALAMTGFKLIAITGLESPDFILRMAKIPRDQLPNLDTKATKTFKKLVDTFSAACTTQMLWGKDPTAALECLSAMADTRHPAFDYANRCVVNISRTPEYREFANKHKDSITSSDKQLCKYL